MFRTHRGGAAAWFVADGWIFDLAGNATPGRDAGEEDSSGTPQDRRPIAERNVAHALRLTFLRSNQARIRTENPSPTKFNFYLGNQPQTWRSGVRGFGRLRYVDMYAGIDVVVREGQGLFAYDLHCAPGVDPAAAALQMRGADRVETTPDGCLLFYTPIGVLKQSAPVAWQELPDGKRLPLTCRVVRTGSNTFGFEVDGRRPNLPLVIDPDWTWGTLFGGPGWEDARNITRTAGSGAGAKMTIAGSTRSSTLPTTTGPTFSGLQDIMVAHFDPTLTGTAQRVWATYIGGDMMDYGYGVTTDLVNNTFVCGLTHSSGATTGYPVTAGALQPTFAGGDMDGFISKLDSTGALTYSTFLGGDANDRICNIHISPTLAITIAGYTTSQPNAGALKPTPGAYRTTVRGLQDAFVGILDSTASTVNYLTYYGGTNNEGWPYDSSNPFYYDMETMGFDVDATGRVLLTGSTWSFGLPTHNAQATSNGGAADAFIAIIDPNQTGNAQLAYGSFFGGNSNDGPEAAAFDVARPNHIVLGGWTYSNNLPVTTGCFNPRFLGGTGGANDMFAVWLDLTKTRAAQVVYATYVSSTSWDGTSDIVVDTRGMATFGGWCGLAFPTTPGAYAETPPAGVTNLGHITRIYPGANGADDLVYATYVTGTGTGGSYVGSLDSDGAGGVLFSGNTASNSFPVPGGPYTTLAGSADGYVAHLWGLNQGIRVLGRPTPAACAGNLNFGAEGPPTPGNASFALTMWNAEPNQPAFLGLGLTLPAPVVVCAADLRINPLIVLALTSNAQGELRIPAPVPASTPPNSAISAQIFVSNSGCCVTSTHVLEIKP